VTTNNLTFGSISFPPPIASIQEFKVDNSTFSAEYGHVSGAIVNLVTRSGTDQYRGEAYEFFRNDALDARNFSNSTPLTRTRSIATSSVGRSVDRSFVAARSSLPPTRDCGSGRARHERVVLSDAQRAAATDPVVRNLLPLIPRANHFDADGTPRFVGAADARVDENTWTADVRHNAGTRNRCWCSWAPAD
jgi:hypothetical protein